MTMRSSTRHQERAYWEIASRESSPDGWDFSKLPDPIRIALAPPPPPSSPKPKPSDFFYNAWDKFLALEPKRAKKTSRAAKNIAEERKTVEKTDKEGLNVQTNVATSWTQAAEACKAKVAAIVKECTRLNQKYRDAVFDMETDPYCLETLDGKDIDSAEVLPPAGAKRVAEIFDDPQFMIDGQTAADVHQGHVGDCWFLAALMAVTAKKDLIDHLCVARDEKVGVYGFVFFRDGEWIYEVIDDKLLLKLNDNDDVSVVKNWDRYHHGGTKIRTDKDKLRDHLKKAGQSLYFSHCKSNQTWLPLIEKAYAKAHGDYSSIEGGWSAEGIEDLTGGVATTIKSCDIMDKDRFWNEELLHVNDKYLFGGGSSTKPTKGVIQNHAYAVLKAYEKDDLKLLKLRNPWGDTEWEGDWSDGSKLWTPEMMKTLEHTFGNDGVFWISYADFLKYFPRINRVRLFTEEWQVAQQWTCVEVPWTVDYLDTKFQFTINEKSPVVLVLSQPDQKYFRGLDGRIVFSLHFRVQPAKSRDSATKLETDSDEDEDSSEDDTNDSWIVRSMHNSGGSSVSTRSVSAEIDDLEPGTYDVVFKVTATRDQEDQTAHDAIMKFAADRRQKLLNVGRRYDYAHTKGNLRGMEDTIQRRWKEEERDVVVDQLRSERAVNQMERERARRRKWRIACEENNVRMFFEGAGREGPPGQEKEPASPILEKDGENTVLQGAKTVTSGKETANTEQASPSTQDIKSTEKETSKDTKIFNAETATTTDGNSGEKNDMPALDEAASTTPDKRSTNADEPSSGKIDNDSISVATTTSDGTNVVLTPESESESSLEAIAEDAAAGAGAAAAADDTTKNADGEANATSDEAMPAKAADETSTTEVLPTSTETNVVTNGNALSSEKTQEPSSGEPKDSSAEPKDASTAPKESSEPKESSAELKGSSAESKRSSEPVAIEQPIKPGEEAAKKEEEPTKTQSDSSPSKEAVSHTKDKSSTEATSQDIPGEGSDQEQEPMEPPSFYGVPFEPDMSFEDDDFDWDSEMDGPAPIIHEPITSSQRSEKRKKHKSVEKSQDGKATAEKDKDGKSKSSSSSRKKSRHPQHHRPRSNKNSSGSGTTNEIFASDPWNAVCVLGLRVYARADVAPKVKVVRG